MSSISSATSEKNCVICYENITSQTSFEEEKTETLDCSHIFHRECIGAWFKQENNCPTCKAYEDTSSPETLEQEITLDQFLSTQPKPLNTEILLLIRSSVQKIRRVRRQSLDETTPLSQKAAKGNSVTKRFFGLLYTPL